MLKYKIPQIVTLTPKTPNFTFLGVKKGCKSRKCLIYTLYCGETGNVTSDSFSDIYRPTGGRWHSSCWAW